MAAERDQNGRYIKGHDSNGGRPKLPADFKVFCQTTAIDKVKDFVKRWPSLDDSMRLKVTEILLDRGWGKPAQHVDADITQHRIIIGDIPDAADY